MNPLKDALSVIKKRKIRYYLILGVIFLFIFSQSFLAGQFLYKTDKKKAEGLLKQIADNEKIKSIIELFKGKNYFTAFLAILLNNFVIGAYSMYFGVIFIIPLLILLLNSVMIGFLFGIESIIPPLLTFPHTLSIIAVGLLEFSSMILVTYEGMRIGMSWIAPKIFKEKKRIDSLKQAIIEGTRILPISFLLLIIAAVIETFAIAIFSTRFAH